MRRYAVGLLIALGGASLGWLAYWTQLPTWILGTCTGTVTTAPGVSAAPCVVPPNLQIPLSPGAGLWWLIGGALLALGLAAVVWWLVSEAKDRREARQHKVEGREPRS
jgi:hypothetical protein